MIVPLNVRARTVGPGTLGALPLTAPRSETVAVIGPKSGVVSLSDAPSGFKLPRIVCGPGAVPPKTLPPRPIVTARSYEARSAASVAFTKPVEPNVVLFHVPAYRKTSNGSIGITAPSPLRWPGAAPSFTTPQTRKRRPHDPPLSPP